MSSFGFLTTWVPRSWLAGAAPVALLCVCVSAGAEDGRGVVALGRLEPKDGVIRVAGPSRPAVVIAQLLVGEGDRVALDQDIAVLDSHALYKAEVARLRAELETARREFQRASKLYSDGVTSDSARDQAELGQRVAQASLERAQAELDLSVVRSPIEGQVLEIHARRGERVGPEGICELARTDQMYAVAEVYETDIARVRLSQRAAIRSPALPKPIGGTVERIGLKVGKLGVFSDDPLARTDARIVEVEIRLDEGAQVAGLTNLQVEIEIMP